MSKPLTIGLVVPFSTDKVPEEGPVMYPGVKFIPRAVGVRALTPEGYDAAWNAILPAAKQLAKEGVDATLSLLAKVPSLYVVRPDLPARDMKEFVALAKSKPGALNYGSAGNGSAGHLAFEYLKAATDIFVVHVPYRGTGPQLTDLLAGRLDAAAVGAPAVLQFIKTGKLRCIATGTPQRIAQLPDVPTVAEQGFPGFEMTQWYGLLAPGRCRAPAADKLAAAAAKAVQGAGRAGATERPTRRSRSAARRPSSRASSRPSRQRWKPVIARAKIKPD